MKAGLWDYIRAAFNARPIGMLIPPNWIGVGLFALLGLLNSGFLVLGAGLELGYLYIIATNPRFQKFIDATRVGQTQQQWQGKLNGIIASLGEVDRQKYRALEQRCQSILGMLDSASPSGLKAQSEGLSRLLWIYVRLLLTRQSITHICQGPDSTSVEKLDAKIAKLQQRLADEKIGEELRRSLTGQVEILKQRQEKQREAVDKLAFLDSELSRIQEQAELIREQAALTTDPETVSQRIDQISATLGGTTQWIREQQQIYGQVEDLLAEPPPIAMPASSAAKESQ